MISLVNAIYHVKRRNNTIQLPFLYWMIFVCRFITNRHKLHSRSLQQMRKCISDIVYCSYRQLSTITMSGLNYGEPWNNLNSTEEDVKGFQIDIQRGLVNTFVPILGVLFCPHERGHKQFWPSKQRTQNCLRSPDISMLHPLPIHK